MENLLIKGDVIKTSLSDSTMVLKVEGNDALLFTGRQFVVAHGVQKDHNGVFWNQGDYYDELPDDIFEGDVKEQITDLHQEQEKNFSYETFCKYVKNKMSFIYQNDEGEYEILQDTEALQGITPDELGYLTEEETLKYIYDNSLFDELKEVIVQATTPYKYREAYKELNYAIENNITDKSNNIIIEGHAGTWYVIDNRKINEKNLFLLESEQYGDEAASLIVDESKKVVLEDVYNGFEDYREHIQELNVNQCDELEDDWELEA